jgi:hypothetical protein
MFSFSSTCFSRTAEKEITAQNSRQPQTDIFILIILKLLALALFVMAFRKTMIDN